MLTTKQLEQFMYIVSSDKLQYRILKKPSFRDDFFNMQHSMITDVSSLLSRCQMYLPLYRTAGSS
jgi:hypothetical protein